MRTTVTLDEDLADHVEDIREADDSDAQAIRRCVRRSRRLEECEKDRDAARAQVDELRSQLMAANHRIDAANELVEYVETEQSYREAGLMTRAKWWLLGMNKED